MTYEAIRQWCRTFGLDYARRLRHRRGRQDGTWHLDELFVKIQGRQQYLWRAVDEDGDVLDILVQSRRNKRAAKRFFRKLLKRQGREPRRLITDKLRSYSAAHRTVMPSVVHSTRQYENNRAEVSHQPTRQRERQMRRFKGGSTGAELTAHAVGGNRSQTSRKTTVANITITTQASPPPTDGGSAVNLGDLGREPLGFSRQGAAFATGPQSG